MFHKIQMILMMKMTVSNNRISRLKESSLLSMMHFDKFQMFSRAIVFVNHQTFPLDSEAQSFSNLDRIFLKFSDYKEFLHMIFSWVFDLYNPKCRIVLIWLYWLCVLVLAPEVQTMSFSLLMKYFKKQKLRARSNLKRFESEIMWVNVKVWKKRGVKVFMEKVKTFQSNATVHPLPLLQVHPGQVPLNNTAQMY